MVINVAEPESDARSATASERDLATQRDFYTEVQQFQVSQDLFVGEKDRREFFHRFQLDHDAVIHEQVDSKTIVKFYPSLRSWRLRVR